MSGVGGKSYAARPRPERHSAFLGKGIAHQRWKDESAESLAGPVKAAPNPNLNPNPSPDADEPKVDIIRRSRDNHPLGHDVAGIRLAAIIDGPCKWSAPERFHASA